MLFLWRLAALVLFLGALSPASAFEGRYKANIGEMKIERRGTGFEVDIEASRPGRGSCGLFNGRGVMVDHRLIATVGKPPDACRATIMQLGDRVTVEIEGSGCLQLHGASCPGFAGTYSRVGGAPARAAAPAQGAVPAQGMAAARGAPFGDWTFEQDGRCPVNMATQGVRIERNRIIVNWTEITTFSNTVLAGCKDDVCTFRQRGGRNVWTTRWLGDNRIAFRGLHSLEGPNNRADATRSTAERAGVTPGCQRPF